MCTSEESFVHLFHHHNTVKTEEVAPTAILPPLHLVSNQLMMIRCGFTGTPKPSVAWYLNGTLVEADNQVNIMDHSDTHPGTTISVMSVIAPTELHYGLYSCVATNAVGNLSLEIPVSAPGKRTAACGAL